MRYVIFTVLYGITDVVLLYDGAIWCIVLVTVLIDLKH